MAHRYRLGVDAGGTFTDFVLSIRDGDVRLYKTPSTPKDPTEAIRAGLELISADLGETIEDIVAACDLCINGTTVGLNALIQHAGAKTGLICTAGHEDSIEIRLGHKEDGYRYDAEYPPAKMLAERYLRVPVRERVLIDGSIHTPMQEEDVRSACALFMREGVEAVAISFVWSVMNAAHERRAAEIVREMLPDVFLSVGSDVYPQVREYTRTSTAVVNAYLGPILERYVQRVDRYFNDLGAQQPVRYFQSNGGLAEGRVLAAKSVYAINSGPASAPQAGLYLTEPTGERNVITVDMGGTSFDITLTYQGVTNVTRNMDFLRYRIGVPMIQVESLGAGGGSIAWIDDFGLLNVGPQSAGADPGPVCYDKGGTQPTVSDANLVLGYLSPEGLLGGTFRLDRVAAARAIKEKVADPLGLSLERAAHGIFTIVNTNMVNGIRRVSVERGFDPRDFVLVGAGGATAAHITALAREIGIKRVLIPKLASGFCAFGQIIADVKYNYLATRPMRLEADAPLEDIEARFVDLEAQARAQLHDDKFRDRDIKLARSMDMRYAGQTHECTVDLATFKIDRKTIEKVKAAFHERHKQLFTYAEPQSLVEIVNLEVQAIGRMPKPTPPVLPKGTRQPPIAASRGTRKLILSASGKPTTAPIYDGTRLKAGNRIKGPAVIEEPTTTILIEPDWVAELDERGTYILSDVG
jgi:N-methylhydantoinase A